MSDILLTKEGYASLKNELNTIETVQMPDIKKRMANARADGDLSENNAWITAKAELEVTRLRISEIRRTLKEAQIVEKETTTSKEVRMGDTVEISVNGAKMTVTIVPTLEADPANKKLSSDSPIGKAIIGKNVGTSVELTTPAGTQKIEILKK